MTTHTTTDEKLTALKSRIAAFDQLANIDANPEEMRRMGYQAIDALVEHLSTINQRPAARRAERAEMEKLLREPLPAGHLAFEQLLSDYQEKIVSYGFQLAHPRFFAYIPASPTYVAILADALATAANLFLGNWLAAPAAAEIELIVIDWFKEIIGFHAAEAGGILTSGGSVANLTALAVARHTKLNDEMQGAVIYASDQTHTSVERAARIIGFRQEQFVYVATDEYFRLDFNALEQQIEADKRAGRRPFCLIANGGTTNTGAVDALEQAAATAKRHNLWLHVDAAYGGFAALTERGRKLLRGIEHADSVTLDPHKWLYAPFEAGCVIFKDVSQSRATFHLLHDYLQDMPRERENVSFYDYGLQLTRGFRALKLWMAMKFYGVETYRALVERSLDLTQLAEALMRRSAVIEVLNEPELSVVCFRYVPAGSKPSSAADEARLDELNAAMAERIMASGEAFFSSTKVNGHYALRFCVLNHRTQSSDIEQAVALIERLGNEVAGV